MTTRVRTAVGGQMSPFWSEGLHLLLTVHVISGWVAWLSALSWWEMVAQGWLPLHCLNTRSKLTRSQPPRGQHFYGNEPCVTYPPQKWCFVIPNPHYEIFWSSAQPPSLSLSLLFPGIFVHKRTLPLPVWGPHHTQGRVAVPKQATHWQIHQPYLRQRG
jgi:hypothetical protein